MISNNWISGNEGGVRLGAASDLHHNVIYANQGGAGVRINSYTMNINHNIILENENPTTYGGGLYSSSGASNINYNVFAGNQAKMGGGAYIASNSTFRNNTVLSNRSSDQGGGLYVTNSNATVDFNTLLGNQSGAGLGGVYIKNYPVFTGNNLYGNASYDLVNGNLAGAGDLKAEFNWWGTIELPEILSHIWDYLDDSTLSLVDFDPAWAYPQLGAPISPPTGLQVLRSGNSLELSWNENPESDTAGYKIYYDTDGPGFPYSGTGLLQGDAPIDVGEALNYTLTSVPDGVYHFGLTAYDSDRDGQDDQTEGNESWFSDDVTVTVGQIPEAGFSAAPTTGPRPLSVNFTNQSSGNIAVLQLGLRRRQRQRYMRQSQSLLLADRKLHRYPHGQRTRRFGQRGQAWLHHREPDPVTRGFQRGAHIRGAATGGALYESVRRGLHSLQLGLW